MMHHDEFFTPQDVDRQIDQASQHSDAEAADVEMLAYLRSHYQLDDSRDQEMLGRIWSRLAPAVASSQFQREQENMSDLRDRSDYDLSRISLRANGGQGAQSRPLGRFLGVLAVAVVVALLASVFVVLAKQRDGTTTPAVHPTATHAGPAPTATGNAAVPLQVTAITMSVTPASLAGMACGTNVTVAYTATLHLAANNPGGTVQFNYTVDNGRGDTSASITVNPGETTKTYTFSWSGALPADHTAPGPGGIQVTSPNQITSPLIAPTGQCTPVAAAPVCGSNFNGSGSQAYQGTLATAYGTVPLPPLSRTVPNDASGGVRGFDICSAGTSASITAFMQQNLPAYGWTLVSSSGGIQTWKSGTGTINWSVPDPLEWNINWRVTTG